MTRLPPVPSKSPGRLRHWGGGKEYIAIEGIEGYIQQMEALPFDQMGSLYLTDQMHPTLYWPPQPTISAQGEEAKIRTR
jgi:hypothetical protein